MLVLFGAAQTLSAEERDLSLVDAPNIADDLAKPASDPANINTNTDTEESTGGESYSVTITGLEESKKLEELIQQTSQLLSLQDQRPQTRGGLRRRIDNDIERFSKTLRSEGYYDSKLSYEISEGDPAAVIISIERGPAYRLAEYKIIDDAENQPGTAYEQRLEDLGLGLGRRAHAPTIAAAQTKLLQMLRREGFPFAKVTDRKVYVEHDKQILSVELYLDSGQPHKFGEVRFNGVESIDESYLRHLIVWQDGALYDEQLLDESERNLMSSELFDSVTMEPLAAEVTDHKLPVEVVVQERPQRTIGFSLNFDSIDGPGGSARWQHRNLFGAGERLTLEAKGSLLEQSLTGRLRKPWFLGEDQTLLAEGGFIREDTDAFESKAITSYLGLERTWGEDWTYSLGGSLEFEQSTDARNTEARTLGLVGVPMAAQYDGTDNLLDPTHGQRLGVVLTPYFATIEESFSFTSTEINASTYHALDEDSRYVFALRGRLGSAFGATAGELPASKRFYAGGGGSVRGYAFQSVGPLDASNDPLGGKSVAEINAEFRLRVTKDIGVVPFLDGGMVSSNTMPSGSEPFRWGAGLGLRYHTAVGPIRFDFAVPLNKRDSDDNYAFYISLGQAF
ncbi:autotransporter assembly complex family protein [Limibacillus sp. MBR-115]|jgi:translocation and assembly module TamA|uniref:autotransporter assembly complex protein TamA n=1 Tax=Limibacillus sp. MBR-115 TaxID=3156465 RepID=UPI003393C0E1